MFIIFKDPDQLVIEDSPDCLVFKRLNILKMWGGLALVLALVSLVATLAVGINLIGGTIAVLYAAVGLWLITTERSVTFDASQQMLYFSTRHLGFNRQNRIIPFSQVDSVYLDFEEHIYPGIKNIIHIEERIGRRWSLFLTLTNSKTVTIAHYRRSHPLGQEPILSKQTAVWESLATKISSIMDKFLIRTPSVPGRAPRTFVEVIDQIVQRRLARLPQSDELASQTIRLRSHPSGSLEVIVNGKNYRELNDIHDLKVRDFIQVAVDEWRSISRSK